jgi:hypothetical protein
MHHSGIAHFVVQDSIYKQAKVKRVRALAKCEFGYAHGGGTGFRRLLETRLQAAPKGQGGSVASRHAQTNIYGSRSGPRPYYPGRSGIARGPVALDVQLLRTDFAEAAALCG